MYRWPGEDWVFPRATRFGSGHARCGDRGLRVRIAYPLVREDPGQRHGDQHRCKESDYSVGFHELSPFTCLRSTGSRYCCPGPSCRSVVRRRCRRVSVLDGRISPEIRGASKKTPPPRNPEPGGAFRGSRVVSRRGVSTALHEVRRHLSSSPESGNGRLRNDVVAPDLHFN